VQQDWRQLPTAVVVAITASRRQTAITVTCEVAAGVTRAAHSSKAPVFAGRASWMDGGCYCSTEVTLKQASERQPPQVTVPQQRQSVTVEHINDPPCSHNDTTSLRHRAIVCTCRSRPLPHQIFSPDPPRLGLWPPGQLLAQDWAVAARFESHTRAGAWWVAR
jgi:hypothetical protein